jgi:hypothetical protein
MITKYFTQINRKVPMIMGLVFAFVLTTTVAYAAMTLSTDTISGSGALNINPTGQPVTVNGDLTVTGTCTGCGGGGGTPAGSDTQIQFNDGGSAFGGDSGLTFDKTTNALNINNGQLNVGGTYSTTDHFATGLINGNLNITPAISDTNGFSISNFNLNIDSSFAGSLSSSYLDYRGFYDNGGGTLGGVHGSYYDIENLGTSIWSSVDGLTVELYNTGTISNYMRGLYIKNDGNTGTNPLLQGIFIDNLSGNATTVQAINYANKFVVDGNGSVTTATVKTTPITVSALPTCNSGAKGTFAYVTDSDTVTWGATVTGGSTNNAGVSCNGTDWTVFSK